jgi:hypothetical protein
METPGIEPDQALESINVKVGGPVSTRLDFDFIEPSSFHLDASFGTTSGDISAT